MFKKILVAVDGSKPSEHAFNQAVEHSVKWNADLIILSVVPEFKIPVYGKHARASLEMSKFQERMYNIYVNVLVEAEHKLKSRYPEINIDKIIKMGRPSDIIVETAKEEDVDLIVMGSRGLGGITGWVLGNTSRQVVESCTKPILIVK